MTADRPTDDKPVPEVTGWNWGALVFTPLWLFRNGFWITFLLFIVATLYVPLLSLAIRLLFFWRGTRWSWGDGRRWRSYEQFADSQYMWNFAAKVVSAFAAMLLVLALLKWLDVLGISGSA